MTNMSKNMLSGRELIAFRLGDQEFCMDVMAVRAIRGWTKSTPLPRAPHDVLGVVNLRGAVLPIVDLSARLGMGAAKPTERHVIIVAQIGNKMAGLLVDAVSDILTITDDNIQPTPEMSSELGRSFAKGIMAIDNRMICLIELNALIDVKESEAA